MAENSQEGTSTGGNNIPYTHRPVFPPRRGNFRQTHGNRSDQRIPSGSGEASQHEGQRDSMPVESPNEPRRGRGKSNRRGQNVPGEQRGRSRNYAPRVVSQPELQGSDVSRPPPLMDHHLNNPIQENSKRGRGGRASKREGPRGGSRVDGGYQFNVNATPFVPASSFSDTNNEGDGRVEAGGPSQRQNISRTRGGNNSRGNRGVAQKRNQQRKLKRPEDPDLPLRDRLKNSLEDNDYECMICCQLITAKQGIWTCKKCYHMFHISGSCIVNWAKKSREEDGQWRCPTCQTKYPSVPYNYYCFCGKQRNPPVQIGETPHSCGNVCGGLRGPGCPHPCTEPCHPGPCVECPVMVSQKCNCGAIEKTTRCGGGIQVSCEKVCNRLLSCGVHCCSHVCHAGSCTPCDEVLSQKCFCGKNEKVVPCHSSEGFYAFSCGAPCEGKYDCGIHVCENRCHSTGDTCGPCAFSPDRINHCPCGKSLLSDLGVIRKICSDPIATCKSICNKVLRCGSAEKPHRCRSVCHSGPCPPCDYNTSVVCRCKQVKRTVPCKEYVEIIEKGEFLCERRCKRKKSCGLHKCQETCCVLEDHFCMQVCNKRLSCGLHNCEALCHLGECGRCLNASFEEQFCHCGRTMRPPPIPCGAPLPECDEPCARPHACNHPVNHKCHSDSTCPPCTFLVERECYGGHEVRKNIPCHIQAVSCGRECGKTMPCGVHTCPRRCHFGECLAVGEKCTLACTTLRSPCEHPCGLPCHEKSPCPETVCHFPVSALCDCGRRKEIMKCNDVEKAKHRLRAVLAENAAEDSTGKEEGEGVLKKTPSMENLSCLSCNDECKKIARNKKLAEALSIVTNDEGDIEGPTVTFTETMKSALKAWPQLVSSLEKIFTGMIDMLNDVTQSSNVASYNFPPMPMDKRRFVHEYANFFHLETVSVDVVPKRSVIVTGRRGVAKPPMILLSNLHKFPSVLKFTGSTTLRSNVVEETKKTDQPADSGMKSLRSERKVIKRMPPKIHVPEPVRQNNAFAVLCSDDDDDGAERKGVTLPPTEVIDMPAVHERDIDWWSDEEEEMENSTITKTASKIDVAEKEMGELQVEESDNVNQILDVSVGL